MTFYAGVVLQPASEISALLEGCNQLLYTV
jgi:hypothetical protein